MTEERKKMEIKDEITTVQHQSLLAEVSETPIPAAKPRSTLPRNAPLTAVPNPSNSYPIHHRAPYQLPIPHPLPNMADPKPTSGVDETPLSPIESQHSLEKHLQMRPEAQDLKNRNILHDTNAAPYPAPHLPLGLFN